MVYSISMKLSDEIPNLLFMYFMMSPSMLKHTVQNSANIMLISAYIKFEISVSDDVVSSSLTLYPMMTVHEIMNSMPTI